MSSWSMEDALQRWQTVIKVFAHIFLAEGPGNERDNFLNPHAGFASRMARCVLYCSGCTLVYVRTMHMYACVLYVCVHLSLCKS